MGTKNNQGQIFIEVALVMLFIATVGFAAFAQLTKLKSERPRYQLTKDSSYAPKNFKSYKK